MSLHKAISKEFRGDLKTALQVRQLRVPHITKNKNTDAHFSYNSSCMLIPLISCAFVSAHPARMLTPHVQCMLEPPVDFYCASIKRATKRMGTDEVTPLAFGSLDTACSAPVSAVAWALRQRS